MRELESQDIREMDPAKDSVQMEPYPSILIGRDKVRNVYYCKYPGSALESADAKDLRIDITCEYPRDEIACSRCKQKTRLLNKKWCKSCDELVNPKKLTDEELAKNKPRWSKEEYGKKDVAAKLDAKEALLKQIDEEPPPGFLKDDEDLAKLPVAKISSFEDEPEPDQDAYDEDDGGHKFQKKVCNTCGGWFYPNSGCQRMCEDCREKKKNALPKKRYPFPCQDCGKDVDGLAAKYCKECRDKRSRAGYVNYKKSLGEKVPELKEESEEDDMTKKGATRPCNICGKPTKGYKCDDCKAKAKGKGKKWLAEKLPQTAPKRDGKVDLLFSPQEMVKEYKMLDGSTLRLFLMDADIVVKVERVLPEGAKE